MYFYLTWSGFCWGQVGVNFVLWTGTDGLGRTWTGRTSSYLFGVGGATRCCLLSFFGEITGSCFFLHMLCLRLIASFLSVYCMVWHWEEDVAYLEGMNGGVLSVSSFSPISSEKLPTNT